jgi:hypothetical protein
MPSWRFIRFSHDMLKASGVAADDIAAITTYSARRLAPTIADLARFDSGARVKLGGWKDQRGEGADLGLEQRRLAMPDRYSDQALHVENVVKCEVVHSVREAVKRAGEAAPSLDWQQLSQFLPAHDQVQASIQEAFRKLPVGPTAALEEACTAAPGDACIPTGTAASSSSCTVVPPGVTARLSPCTFESGDAAIPSDLTARLALWGAFAAAGCPPPPLSGDPAVPTDSSGSRTGSGSSSDDSATDSGDDPVMLEWLLAKGPRGRLHLVHPAAEHGGGRFRSACGRSLLQPSYGTSLPDALDSGRPWSPRCFAKLPKSTQRRLLSETQTKSTGSATAVEVAQ